jgi:uncharacterized repeat protein (TIGR01451 family)
MAMIASVRWVALLSALALCTISRGAIGQVVFSASGASPAGIQATVDSFRAALGALNPNTPGSFGSGRREINWDGVPDASSAPNNLAANFFNVNSPRGVVFTTPGTGFQVSARVASGTPVLFGNINPTYPTTFQAFSPERLFTALGSNIVDVQFFVPGSATPALSRGFGAVFTDVDAANTTSIALFDGNNNSLGQFFVPAGVSGGLSFLGIVEPAASIARVRITSGNTLLGPNDNGTTIEVVVMDDFIYGEPVSTVAPPTISKSFGASSVVLNGTTTLTFTLANPNSAAALTGIGFTDTLPAGLVVSTPNGLTGACGGGAITSVAGSNSVSLSAATLGPASSCTFAVNVTATGLGAQNNVTSAVTSTEGGNGGSASASLVIAAPPVVAPPTIAKSFGASSITLNGTTTLTFTLANPNSAAPLTGVGFTDTLPGGLVVSTPNGLTGACGGGAITSVAGSNSVSLSAATLGSAASCTFAVNVRATGLGAQDNVTSAVTSTEGGNGGTASASLGVAAPAATSIPTLQEWAVALLGLLLWLVGADALRRRR